MQNLELECTISNWIEAGFQWVWTNEKPSEPIDQVDVSCLNASSHKMNIWMYFTLIHPSGTVAEGFAVEKSDQTIHCVLDDRDASRIEHWYKMFISTISEGLF